MDQNNKLALIIAYYLSKFDIVALHALGYTQWSKAFADIGSILSVNPNTIKNMRDEFDPLHENHRVGWYQRELRPSRLEIIQKYHHLSQYALSDIVKSILNSKENAYINEEIADYASVLNCDDDNIPTTRDYTTRGITGKNAEDIFIDSFNKGLIGEFKGNLIDKRNDGCGYDFELDSSDKYVFEIKGAISQCSDILFTDKEWAVANELSSYYILVVISNINSSPTLKIYRNPAKLFTPQKQVHKVISIDWTIDKKQLESSSIN